MRFLANPASENHLSVQLQPRLALLKQLFQIAGVLDLITEVRPNVVAVS
jgi:hypothetical protein